MVKVLHVMSGFGGGISSFILNKSIALSESNVTFDVLAYDECSTKFINAINQTGGQVYKMPNPKKESWSEFYKIVNSVMSSQPNDTVVHCHMQGYRVLPIYMIAKKNNISRFIIHAHTDAEERISKNFESKLNRFINNHIADEKISCGIKATNHIFGSKNSQTVMHIPNSIHEEKFLKKPDCTMLKEQIIGQNYAKYNVIGNVARFHKQKNHEFMIDVIERLVKKNVEFKWLFIGEGSKKDSVEKLVVDKGLENNVIFLGVRSDIPELFSIMDLFVLPSLYEGLPTVSIEAQASGVFSLLSDQITKEADLNIELVDYLPISSADIWANKIVEIFKGSKKIDRGIRESALIAKKFTNHASAKLYLDFLNKKIESYQIV